MVIIEMNARETSASHTGRRKMSGKSASQMASFGSTLLSIRFILIVDQLVKTLKITL